MKVFFKFKPEDIVYHKLSVFPFIVLQRTYQDGSSGEGEIQYLCRGSDDIGIQNEPVLLRELELQSDTPKMPDHLMDEEDIIK